MQFVFICSRLFCLVLLVASPAEGPGKKSVFREVQFGKNKTKSHRLSH